MLCVPLLVAALAEPPTVPQYEAVLDTTLEAIETRHPAPFRYHSREDWHARAQEIRDRLDEMSEEQFFVELSALVGWTADVHTALLPAPGSTPMSRSLPLRCWKFPDGLYVRAAAPEHSAWVGARIDRIGTTSVDAAWQRILEFCPGENPAMCQYTAQFRLQFPAFLHAIGLTETPERATFTVTLPDGSSRTLELTASPASSYRAVMGQSVGFRTPDGWPEGHPEPGPRWLKRRGENYWFESVEEHNAVYLQLNQPRSEPSQPWSAWCTELFEFIDERGIERLVIDLRHNGGGDTYLNQELLHGLIGSPVNRPGHLTALIGPVTQSAGVALAVQLERETHCVLIGEPVGAHPNFFNAPGGRHTPLVLGGGRYWLRISSVLEQYSDPLDDRQTVAPDVLAPLSHEQYVAGDDPALAAALSLAPSKASRLLADTRGSPLQGWHRWQRPSQASARPHVVDTALEALLDDGEEEAADLYHQMRAGGMAVPDEDGLNRLGYDLLARNQKQEALAVLHLAAAAYPRSANALDSYSEALEAVGDHELSAIVAARALIWMRPDEAPTFAPVERQRIQRLGGHLGPEDALCTQRDCPSVAQIVEGEGPCEECGAPLVSLQEMGRG